MADDPAMGVEEPGFALLQRSDAVTEVRPERGAWVRFCEAVAAVIRDGGAPPVTAASAVAVMDILDAARRRGVSQQHS